ncbi:MAG TPA: alpha/beta hydrolase [Acidobacteriota bacterium]|nr:alpha/beta hydrolase [Acidobacteriota bacterium]
MKRKHMLTILYWLAAIGIALLFFTILIRWAEPRVAFHPVPGPTPPPPSFERFEVTTGDGINLTGWQTTIEPGRPVLLYICGNAGNLTGRHELLQGAAGRGIGIAAFNYRGTGESAGEPSEEGVYRDAEAVYDHLLSAGAAPEDIVVWGHSIGGAVACELALRRRCAGLILESTFRSARVMAQRMIPWLPVGLFLTLRLDNEKALARLDLPILFIHGTADPVVPVDDSRYLHNLARGPKELWLVDGADHNDNHMAPDGEFYDRITRFAGRVAASAGSQARPDEGGSSPDR